MQDIRPISDLRNKFTEISRDVHETGRPIFLTKNGYGNMVVMSKEAYDNLSFETEVAYQLRQATLEAKQELRSCPQVGRNNSGTSVQVEYHS